MDFPLVILMTDFGLQDGFVGVMKSVLYGRLQHPLPIVDLSHQIEPQNLRHGTWVLESSFSYFPPRSVFVGVVDPGVGSVNQASLIAYWTEQQQFFIAPNNGLLTPVFDKVGDKLQIFPIQNAAFYQELAERSQTFHGRDVYAPVAAMAANALHEQSVEAFLSLFGEPVESVCRFPNIAPQRIESETGTRLDGMVVHIDIFGNAITNIPNAWIPQGSLWNLHVESQVYSSIPVKPNYQTFEYQTSEYSDQVMMIPSSSGTIEFSLYQKSAAQLLQMKVEQSFSLMLN